MQILEVSLRIVAVSIPFYFLSDTTRTKVLKRLNVFFLAASLFNYNIRYTIVEKMKYFRRIPPFSNRARSFKRRRGKEGEG